MRPTKIISGGQTGADQGGLFAAESLGIDTGGYAPYRFMTERGPANWLETQFGLFVLSGGYPKRTRRNVAESDGTVIFTTNLHSGGTVLTINICKELGKPYLVNPDDGNTLHLFCVLNDIKTLNVAGNRESKSPGIYDKTFQVIREAFCEEE